MEFTLIDRIRQHTAQPRDDVQLGIGDDAALVTVPAGQQLVAAIDTMVEGVHFPPGTSAADLGWKSLAVNLSDLAAMGATPAWALLAMTLPDATASFVDDFAEGFAQLARSYRLALVGGDTTRGPLTISVTVHGFVPQGQALTRGGAQPGDAIFVTGSLGDAAAGLALHEKLDNNDADVALLIQRLHRPTPRIEAGIALRGRASACIDISDGLLADLGHICKASGVGAIVDASLLPRSAALCARFDDVASRDFALSGGDDYELCFTVPEQHVPSLQRDLSHLGCGMTKIGHITAGGCVNVFDAQGNALEPKRRGWNHFSA